MEPKNMRLVVPLLITFIVFGCASKPDVASRGDSTSVDTSAFIDEFDSAFVTSSDASDIRAAVEKLIDEQEERSEDLYTLRLNASGYEYQTDEVWSFDSLFNLVHCYQNWSSEGTEGISHHFFRQERLYAIFDENSFGSGKDINIFHLELGGINQSEPENGPDSVAKPLEKKFFSDSERDLKTHLAEIIRLLKENSGNLSEGDPLTLRLENESSDEEMPGKETTEITVDRTLLDDLIK
jgi:hypothetical protein